MEKLVSHDEITLDYFLQICRIEQANLISIANGEQDGVGKTIARFAVSNPALLGPLSMFGSSLLNTTSPLLQGYINSDNTVAKRRTEDVDQLLALNGTYLRELNWPRLIRLDHLLTWLNPLLEERSQDLKRLVEQKFDVPQLESRTGLYEGASKEIAKLKKEVTNRLKQWEADWASTAESCQTEEELGLAQYFGLKSKLDKKINTIESAKRALVINQSSYETQIGKVKTELETLRYEVICHVNDCRSPKRKNSQYCFAHKCRVTDCSFPAEKFSGHPLQQWAAGKLVKFGKQIAPNEYGKLNLSMTEVFCTDHSQEPIGRRESSDFQLSKQQDERNAEERDPPKRDRVDKTMLIVILLLLCVPEALFVMIVGKLLSDEHMLTNRVLALLGPVVFAVLMSITTSKIYIWVKGRTLGHHLGILVTVFGVCAGGWYLADQEEIKQGLGLSEAKPKVVHVEEPVSGTPHQEPAQALVSHADRNSIDTYIKGLNEGGLRSVLPAHRDRLEKVRSDVQIVLKEVAKQQEGLKSGNPMRQLDAGGAMLKHAGNAVAIQRTVVDEAYWVSAISAELAKRNPADEGDSLEAKKYLDVATEALARFEAAHHQMATNYAKMTGESSLPRYYSEQDRNSGGRTESIEAVHHGAIGPNDISRGFAELDRACSQRGVDEAGSSASKECAAAGQRVQSNSDQLVRETFDGMEKRDQERRRIQQEEIWRQQIRNQYR